MISSRRLAREWALRILYQQEVGRVTLAESLASSLERLRLEFVQRGSRTASGSKVEELCLDYLTQELRDVLPYSRPDFDVAIANAAARLLDDVPFWQEQRLERAMKTAAPGLSLNPPRLLAPLSESDLMAVAQTDLRTELTEQETDRLRNFLNAAADELPRLLDSELRQNARQFARELAQSRPLEVPAQRLQSLLLARREEYNRVQVERWHKVAAIVQKQLADWLRTAGFTLRLATGVDAQREEIDAAVSDLAAGWRLERQPVVDRNILRIAAFEILYLPGVPGGVSINEAVELAKRYSTAESGRFVNGVLGALTVRGGEKSTHPDGMDTLELADQDDPVDLPEFSALEDNDTE